MAIVNGQRSGLKYSVKMHKLNKLITSKLSKVKKLRLKDILNFGLICNLQILKEKVNFKFGMMALINISKIV